MEKKISFIDSKYNTLFFINDGENIVLTYSDGEKVVRKCEFIDECHTKVGHNIYHICQFAEIMERNGTSYAPENPVGLPDMCFGTLPSSGELIQIKKGENGYHRCSWSSPYREQNKREAVNHNRRMDVTMQQSAAMLGGSLFGWNTPAAKPKSYDYYGKPKNRKIPLTY